MTEVIQLKGKDIPKIREQILKEQNGLCLICGKVPEKPCLDHHHTKKQKGTGQIRGVICLGCNIFLGNIENRTIRCGFNFDNLPMILRNIADYLEKEQYSYLHPSEAEKKPILSIRCFNKLKKAYKQKYPKRKELQYPKSKHLTKDLKKKFVDLNIEIVYNKK